MFVPVVTVELLPLLSAPGRSRRCPRRSRKSKPRRSAPRGPVDATITFDEPCPRGAGWPRDAARDVGGGDTTFVLPHLVRMVDPARVHRGATRREPRPAPAERAQRRPVPGPLMRVRRHDLVGLAASGCPLHGSIFTTFARIFSAPRSGSDFARARRIGLRPGTRSGAASRLQRTPGPGETVARAFRNRPACRWAAAFYVQRHRRTGRRPSAARRARARSFPSSWMRRGRWRARTR
jgi:hypothetical protein